jgi:DNA-binding MarR family transcriptional regulator
MRKEIAFRFREAWQKIDNQYNLYAKSLGLNFTSMLVLEILFESKEPPTQRDLCEKLSLPKQLINSIITSFWEQKLVELQTATDRRYKKIILTTDGKDYAKKISDALQNADDKALDCFTDDEIMAFVSATEKYAKSYEIAMQG